MFINFTSFCRRFIYSLWTNYKYSFERGAFLSVDTLYTAQNETDGLGTEGEVRYKGLKSLHKDRVNEQAGSILSATDWYWIRAADGGTAVPSSVSTHRTAVRTKANAMCTLIDNASDVDALAALYVYNDATPPVRPLGEWPTL